MRILTGLTLAAAFIGLPLLAASPAGAHTGGKHAIKEANVGVALHLGHAGHLGAHAAGRGASLHAHWHGIARPGIKKARIAHRTHHHRLHHRVHWRFRR